MIHNQACRVSRPQQEQEQEQEQQRTVLWWRRIGNTPRGSIVDPKQSLSKSDEMQRDSRSIGKAGSEREREREREREVWDGTGWDGMGWGSVHLSAHIVTAKGLKLHLSHLNRMPIAPPNWGPSVREMR